MHTGNAQYALYMAFGCIKVQKKQGFELLTYWARATINAKAMAAAFMDLVMVTCFYYSAQSNP
jgi:hypothetical protein